MKKNIAVVNSREEVVSMFLGLGVVIIVVLVIVNFIIRAKGSISVPGVTTNVESNSLHLANKIDSSVTGSYVVKAGDSLWKIANKNHAHVEDIKKLNNLNSEMLHPGQVLQLP